MKAIVKQIQIGGGQIVDTLEDACIEFLAMIHRQDVARYKINFTIELPNGEIKAITIRDEGNETVAYGDFEGLPSMLDYAENLRQEGKL